MKNKLFTILTAATILCWITVTVSCNKDIPIVGDGSEFSQIIDVESIAISPFAVNLNPGNEAALHVIITPDNASYGTVIWSSGNNDIAQVDQTGKVSAIATGTTTVRAVVNNKSTTCTVNVTNESIEVQSVSIAPSSATIAVAQTVQLIPSVIPSDATGVTFTWSSSNPSVATVSSLGIVSAVESGDATIKVTTNNGTWATAAITVQPAAAITYKVNQSACTGCGNCISACPNRAITMTNRKAYIDPSKCDGCGKCVSKCGHHAIVINQ